MQGNSETGEIPQVKESAYSLQRYPLYGRGKHICCSFETDL